MHFTPKVANLVHQVIDFNRKKFGPSSYWWTQDDRKERFTELKNALIAGEVTVLEMQQWMNDETVH